MARRIPSIKESPNAAGSYPISYEAERAVLSALMTNRRSVPEILSGVTFQDFIDSNHQAVFRIAAELFAKQEPIDLVTVSVAYRKQANSAAFSVADLFKDEFNGNYKSHVAVLKDMARRRRVQDILTEASGKVAGALEIDDVISGVMSDLSQAADAKENRPVPLDKVVMLSIKRIEKAMEQKSITTGIPTGFAKFDETFGGLQPGELIVLGARPSVGKSALLAGIALGLARRGIPALIVNAEMELIEVGTRMLAGATKIANFDLRRGNVRDAEIESVVSASLKLSPLPVWIYDETRWDVIKAQVRAHKLAHKNLGVVLIDYVQRIRTEKQRDERRDQELGRIARDAKDIAKALGLTVILAAQLNRVVAKESKEPELQDLRESGDLEADADGVWFLHRYKQSEPWSVHWLVKKNRNGPLGGVHLRFVGGEVRFYDWEDV